VDAGTVLEWVDKAAYAAAVGWAKSYCVTAYVGNIHFADPVNSGDMVEVEATIVYTGRSSMHIHTVVSSGDPKGGPATMRSQCMVIFVAVGPDGRPIPVQQFEPQTPAEIEQRDHALARIKGPRADRGSHEPAGIYRRRHGRTGHAAVHGGPHRRELGREGPWRHRHEMDR
jgi:acyl-CoA hydrolase